MRVGGDFHPTSARAPFLVSRFGRHSPSGNRGLLVACTHYSMFNRRYWSEPKRHRKRHGKRHRKRHRAAKEQQRERTTVCRYTVHTLTNQYILLEKKESFGYSTGTFRIHQGPRREHLMPKLELEFRPVIFDEKQFVGRAREGVEGSRMKWQSRASALAYPLAAAAAALALALVLATSPGSIRPPLPLQPHKFESSMHGGFAAAPPAMMRPKSTEELRQQLQRPMPPSTDPPPTLPPKPSMPRSFQPPLQPPLQQPPEATCERVCLPGKQCFCLPDLPTQRAKMAAMGKGMDFLQSARPIKAKGR